MAPEILRYEKYNAKADLWSVGAVLYEMVTGKPPFRAQNHVELLRKIEKGMDRIKFPGDTAPDDVENGVGYFKTVAGSSSLISEDVKEIIRSLLKRNPVERISFEEFFRHSAVRAELEPASAQSFGGEYLTVPITSEPRSLGPTSNGTPNMPISRREQYEIPPFAQQTDQPFISLRDRRPQMTHHRKQSEDYGGYTLPTRTNSAPRDAYLGSRGFPPFTSRGATPTRKAADDIVDISATNAQAFSDNRLAHPSSQPSSSGDTKRFGFNNEYQHQNQHQYQYQRRPLSAVGGSSRRVSDDNNSPPNSIYNQERGGYSDKRRINTAPSLTKSRKGETIDADDDIYIEREYVVINKAAVAANAFADGRSSSLYVAFFVYFHSPFQYWSCTTSSRARGFAPSHFRCPSPKPPLFLPIRPPVPHDIIALSTQHASASLY